MWARHKTDTKFHIVDDVPIRGSYPTRCSGKWPASDEPDNVERRERPAIADRCGACQESLVEQRISQLAAPANYDWPGAHELDIGGET